MRWHFTNPDCEKTFHKPSVNGMIKFLKLVSVAEKECASLKLHLQAQIINSIAIWDCTIYHGIIEFPKLKY